MTSHSRYDIQADIINMQLKKIARILKRVCNALSNDAKQYTFTKGREVHREFGTDFVDADFAVKRRDQDGMDKLIGFVAYDHENKFFLFDFDDDQEPEHYFDGKMIESICLDVECNHQNIPYLRIRYDQLESAEYLIKDFLENYNVYKDNHNIYCDEDYWEQRKKTSDQVIKIRMLECAGQNITKDNFRRLYEENPMTGLVYEKCEH